MEINVSYLKNDFNSEVKLLNAKLGDIARKLSFVSVPEEVTLSVQGESVEGINCQTGVNQIFNIINGYTGAAGQDYKGLSATLNSIIDEIDEMVDAYEWAENYALDASVSLNENTKYTENSAGGGNSNTIRKDNIYASPDDDFTVKYIAIYANGTYKYNMILNDENKGQSVDDVIDELKANGVIGEDDTIQLSMGITKEQEDGSLGDIGWLPRVSYNPNEKSSGITKTSTREYDKMEYDQEIEKVADHSRKSTSSSGNYDEKFAPLDQVFYTEDGQQVNLAEMLSNLENNNDSNIDRLTYSIEGYSGGVYQNSIGTDYDGNMSVKDIQSIRNNLDTKNIHEGSVPHIIVNAFVYDKEGNRKVEEMVLFLNKEDVTLPKDRIDLMSPSTTSVKGKFVSRNNLPEGDLEYERDGGIDGIINYKKVDKIKVTNGHYTVTFDADDEDTKAHVEEYIKAMYYDDPYAEVTVSGLKSNGKTAVSSDVNLYDLDRLELQISRNEDDEYLNMIKGYEEKYGPSEELDELREDYISDSKFYMWENEALAEWQEFSERDNLSDEVRADVEEEIKNYTEWSESGKTQLNRSKNAIRNYTPSNSES